MNETTVALAATNTGNVYFYTLSPPSSQPAQKHRTLKYRSFIHVPFYPDNLSVARGKHPRLLIAGHPHLGLLTRFAKTRWICNRPEQLAKPEHASMREKCGNVHPAPSWVAEWTEQDGLRHLWSGWAYPSSATAVKDDSANVGLVAGLYAKGLMVWRE